MGVMGCVVFSLSEETSFDFNTADIGVLVVTVVLAVVYFFTKVSTSLNMYTCTCAHCIYMYMCAIWLHEVTRDCVMVEEIFWQHVFVP